MAADDAARRPDVYTHGHHESVLQSHRWRTAENSAGYLLPHLRPGTDLLDVGCGPAALASLLPANVRYHGIGIAIQEPAPNLIEADLVEQPIAFPGMTFDIVVAQGVSGYTGDIQSQKLADTAALVRDGGTFLCTYQNFARHKKYVIRAVQQRPW